MRCSAGRWHTLVVKGCKATDKGVVGKRLLRGRWRRRWSGGMYKLAWFQAGGEGSRRRGIGS